MLRGLKKVVEPVVDLKPIVEEIVAIEIEETNETSIEEVQSIEMEVEVNTETPTVVEPTIKKETNTYKNKKNKYKYTSSF